MMTREQLQAMLLNSYDADDLVDILNISSEEIIDRFDDKLDALLEEEGEVDYEID